MSIRKRRTNWITRAIILTGGWLPLMALGVDGFAGKLTINPIQEIVQRLGRFALYFLILSLACTPLNTLIKIPNLPACRRSLGLFSFLYATLHFYIIIAIDYGFNFSLIQNLILQKPFALIGFAAGIILTSLAVTSFDIWKIRLKVNWKRLHNLVYLAGTLAILHFAWARKGNVLTLSGNIKQPVILGATMMILFLARIPKIRQYLSVFGSMIAKVKL